MKLTQKTIAALALPEGKRETIIFDEDMAGFGLRVRAGGKRVWIFQYKIGTQNRRITLGSVAALTAARARETAGDLHAAIRLGRDPAGEKSEGRMRAAETMAAVLPAFLAYQRGRLKPRSLVETERHLQKNAKPLHPLHCDSSCKAMPAISLLLLNPRPPNGFTTHCSSLSRVVGAFADMKATKFVC
jgi:hypothetical protein